MEGTMETTDEPMARMFSPEQIAGFERASKEIEDNLAPPGALGLPEALDIRRRQYGITNGAFRVQAAFDRILVFQIPEAHFEKGYYGNTGIIIPENAKDGRKRGAPRGVIVSAGLRALDNLRSNGFELGDIVYFNQVAPWRIETDVIGGKMQYVLVLRDGDLIGGEDVARRLQRGDLVRKSIKDGGKIAHVYQSRDGSALKPSDPWMSEDY